MKGIAGQRSDVELTGYSERGVLNSLLHELSYHKDGLRLLGSLLTQIRFPFRTQALRVEPVSSAEVIIEQSLADFGDSDCVALLSSGSRAQTVFVEAKVTTSQAPARYFEREFGFFRHDVGKTRKLGGDLFSQLYRKLVLTKAVARVGFDEVKANGIVVENGERYRKGTVRQLGGNPVVLRVAEKIAAHLSDVLLVAIVPLGRSDPRDTEEFATMARGLLSQSKCVGDELGLELWGDFLKELGLLTWLQVEAFCSEHSLDKTMATFHHNAGQISAHLKSNSAEG